MEWVACVGIDWGDKQHACMIQTRQGTRQAMTLGSSPEDVHRWVRELRERFPEGTGIDIVFYFDISESR